jgi:hypothetical protein
MSTTDRLTIALAVTAAVVFADTRTVPAQCRGGGGAPSGSDTARFARLSNENDALAATMAARAFRQQYASSLALTMQREFLPTQQQMLTERQQMMRQQAEQRYKEKQERLAMRRERADATRAARADRAVARLKTNRESDQTDGLPASDPMYAATTRGNRGSF